MVGHRTTSDESPDDPIPDLDEHGRFVRNLAWRLLHDEDAAEDVVQETLLAAVKAKPDTRRSLRPWLATVARNVIRRRFRGEGRRRRREEAAARPESLPATSDLAGRAEMLKAVVDAVLSLDEPNRSTVLLRYYEDLPPREIAVRQGVGVETVRGRLKRAVQQLRRHLDRRHPRGRAGWAPVLAGLCGFEVPAKLLAGAGGSAVVTAGGEAVSQTASGAVAGGLKGAAAAFLLGVGVASLGTWAAATIVGTGGGQPAVGGSDVTHSTLTADVAPGGPSPAGAGQPTDAASRFHEARSRNHALLDRRQALLRRLESLTTPPAPSDPGAFRFGLPERVDVFDRANWRDLAHHIVEMNALMPRFKEIVASGHLPVGPVVQKLQGHNRPLAVFAIGLGKALDLGQPNRAFTHPAVIANLVRAALELAENPLTRFQEIAIRTLGDAWQAEQERLRELSASDAPAIAHTIAEVETKHRFLEDLKRVLEPSQRDVLFHPETEGRIQLDLLSPALLHAPHHVVPAEDDASLQRALLVSLFGMAGNGRTGLDLSPYLWIGRGWVDDIPDALTPRVTNSADLHFPHVVDAQIRARAQRKATERILAMGLLAPAEAAALRRVSMLIVPRIRAAPGPVGDPPGGTEGE